MQYSILLNPDADTGLARTEIHRIVESALQDLESASLPIRIRITVGEVAPYDEAAAD